MDNRKANDEKWTRRSSDYDEAKFGHFRLMQKELIDGIDLDEADAFLDVGCGTGWAVEYLYGKKGGSGTFHGIDIARGMIERAERLRTKAENVRFAVADAADIPLEDGSIDVLICTNSFHHYPEPEKAVREFVRILRPGGRFYVLDVTADDVFLRAVNAVVRKREAAHVNFYSSREFQRMIAAAGAEYEQRRLGRFRYPMKIHVGGKRL